MPPETASRAIPLPDVEPLCRRYREGDVAVAEQLLQRFHPYLTKWLSLLRWGRWDRRDGELRHFLAMLATSRSHAIHSVPELTRLMRDACEPADLEQELQVALLECCLRSQHIATTFRFYVKARVLELTRDALVRRRGAGVPDNTAAPEPHDHPDIDDRWVAGLTCTTPFDRLTVRQRNALRHCYYLQRRQQEAAVLLGISVRQLQRELETAREILSARLAHELKTVPVAQEAMVAQEATVE